MLFLRLRPGTSQRRIEFEFECQRTVFPILFFQTLTKAHALRKRLRGKKEDYIQSLTLWLGFHFTATLCNTHVAAHDAIVEDTDMFPSGF